MTPILPTVNAVLNATAAVLLVWGYTLIRRKRIQAHRKVMTAAFVTSCVFLTCYLIYHYQARMVRRTRPPPRLRKFPACSPKIICSFPSRPALRFQNWKMRCRRMRGSFAGSAF